MTAERATSSPLNSSVTSTAERLSRPRVPLFVRARSGAPLADQFVSSVTNGLTLLAAALLRTNPGVLGEIAVVSAVVMLQTDAVRAWVVLPAQLSNRTSARRRLGMEGLLAGIPIAIVALVVGLWVGSMALVAAALCLPGVALFETLRALWLGDRCASRALRWDLAWFASTAGLLVAVWLGSGATATTLTIAWLMPGALLAVTAWMLQAPAHVGTPPPVDKLIKPAIGVALAIVAYQFLQGISSEVSQLAA